MPTRTCIGCRATDEQSSMIRLVRRGNAVVDGTQPRAEGRGAYLHRDCLDLVLQRKAVPRAFHGATLDPEVVDRLRGAQQRGRHTAASFD